MTLHILTLSWNGADKLTRLAPTLQNNLISLGMEACWHIKDNSTQSQDLKINSNWPQTTLYPIGHNRDNFAEGVNYLFDKAEPQDDDLILLLNNDVVFNDNISLSQMVSLLERTQAKAVGARLLFTGSNRIQHCGVAFGEKFGGMPWHLKRGKICAAEEEQNRYFQAVTAAVCLLKAKDFRAVGKMDTKLVWAFEDISLMLKLGKMGKIAYCGQTNISHEESASLKKNPVNKLFLQSNLAYFKSQWWKDGKPTYQLDYDSYLNDPGYNLIDGD